MAQFQTRPANALDKVDPVWSRIRQEAEDIARREPELASFIYENILHHDTLEAAVVHRVSRAARPCRRVERTDPAGLCAMRLKISRRSAKCSAPTSSRPSTAIRRPTRFIEPVLYYKGFHAIQTHRLAHWLLEQGPQGLRDYLQSRSSAVFQCDIHPAAKIGRGIFLDHATGLVVGETAVIDDDVSILHGVTLGGTGKDHGDRHPKIRRRRDDRRRREDPRQYRSRPLRAHRRGLGGHQAGAEQRHRRRRAGESGRRGRLRRAVAHHGPDVPGIMLDG